MKKKIIALLKKENHLMTMEDIYICLQDANPEITQEEVSATIRALSIEKIITSILDGGQKKYCYIEPVKYNPTQGENLVQIKKLNKKIALFLSLISTVFIGLILFIVGFAIEDTTTWAIGLLLFMIVNLILGIITGPFGKIASEMSDPSSGCSYVISYTLFIGAFFIGFVFAIITTKKLFQEKNNLK